MYVLFDLEWVTAEDGTPTMTQLAALRTDGAWQSQETTLSAKPALSVREQNARWVQASPYNYIYLKNSPVFHRRECRLVLNSKELLGSVHYRTAAKGRRPCKVCRPLPFDIAWAAIILCGVPIILEAIIGLVTEFDIKADVLVSLALIASVCIGETFAAGEVAFIMQLGGLLEELTVAKARAGIEKLVHLTPQTARVLKNGTETVVPAEQVQVGDVLRVLPGETVPVDGIITAGQTSINQAVMTSESLPVDKTVGDEVSSGTVNQFGAFEMRAAKVGEDSSIQRMIRLVQSADAGKAIVRCCKRDLGAELTAAQDFRMIPGRGVAATVEGVQLLAGNPELFKSEGVDFAVPASAEAHLQQGATITYLAVNGVFAGYIALSDTLRAESADTIRQLTALGVQPVLLTDDHASAANAIAGQLGIREVRANCLPQDKLRCIDEFQQKGEPVCNAGSVLVIINSALLLNWRKKA